MWIRNLWTENIPRVPEMSVWRKTNGLGRSEEAKREKKCHNDYTAQILSLFPRFSVFSDCSPSTLILVSNWLGGTVKLPFKPHLYV